jgi:nitroreductase
MKLYKLLMIAAVLVSAAACCPKKAAEKSALDVIMSRKSVRSYTEEAIPAEKVEVLLKAAMAAPTAMNVQPWRFVVVTDQEVKDKLAGPRGGMIAKAPLVIVVCGETTFMRKPWGQPDAEPVEMENIFWYEDCAAATENLLLAAEALGLGAVWTAGYPAADRMQPAIDALGLPDNVKPFCIIPIGYPAGDDQPKDKWKPENIHYDKW